jgi:hypothetical protein
MLWARPNGGQWNGSGTADPATNVGGLDISQFARCGVYPFAAMGASGDSCTFNFGPSGFTGTVPSGFSAGWPDNTTTPYADGAATHAQGGGSSLTATINTGGNNRLLMMLVNVEVTSGAPPTVSGIATTGLAWSKRASLVYTTNNNIELWTAVAPTQLTAASAAITLSGSCDQVTATYVPWVNVPNTGFFDTNAALPATASGTTSGASINVTTTSGGVMLLGCIGSGSPSQIVTGGVPISHGTGCGLIKGVRDASGANYNFASILGRYQSAAATAQAMNSNAGANNWGMLGDALVFGGVSPEADLTASPALGLTMNALLHAGIQAQTVVNVVT